jgi:hypothetical protein
MVTTRHLFASIDNGTRFRKQFFNYVQRLPNPIREFPDAVRDFPNAAGELPNAVGGFPSFVQESLKRIAPILRHC